MIKRVILCCFSLALVSVLNIFLVYADTDSFLKNASPAESSALIEQNKNNPEFKIVDVRTPAEFSEGHLYNSDSVDFYSKTFLEDLQKLDREKTYLIYCRSGGRSSKTVTFMKDLGFKKVYNMSGGFQRWRLENFPTTK